MTCSMKPCKITSRSSISERLLDNNKTTAKIQRVQYLVSACIIIPTFLAVAYILVYKP